MRDKAPHFVLPSNDEQEISLLALGGSKIVLYFYPKDDTSGCTAEAINFSSLKADFDEESTILIGISPDSIASHKKFHQKHNLSITLLADESKEVLKSYDVWKEKSMFGKKYMGVVRTTFLIDEKGIIAQIWKPVTLKNHAQSVLKMVKSLKQ